VNRTVAKRISWIAGLGPGVRYFIIIYILQLYYWCQVLSLLGAGNLGRFGAIYVSMELPLSRKRFLIGRYLARDGYREGKRHVQGNWHRCQRRLENCLIDATFSPFQPIELCLWSHASIFQRLFSDLDWDHARNCSVRLHRFIDWWSRHVFNGNERALTHPIEWALYAIGHCHSLIIYVMHIVKKALANKITSWRSEISDERKTSSRQIETSTGLDYPDCCSW